MRRSARQPVPATVLVAGALLCLAPALFGWACFSEAGAAQGSNDPVLEATATRQAELAELSALRTQVARYEATRECPPDGTPKAAATPMAPAQAGTALKYGDDWTVTVTDLSLMPTFGTATAQGIFARVSMMATNHTNRPLRFPYDDLVLRDSLGRTYIPAIEAKTQLEAHYFDEFPPSLPSSGFVIFDVASDAEGPFIVESTVDPAFRVVIEVQLRG